jgi:hypothetical protein
MGNDPATDFDTQLAIVNNIQQAIDAIIAAGPEVSAAGQQPSGTIVVECRPA